MGTLMHLIGRDTLSTLQNKHVILDKWLSAWIFEITNSRWWHPNDVINQFPKVKEFNGKFLFQTELRDYYIEVQIAFPQGIVQITGYKEIPEDNNEPA